MFSQTLCFAKSRFRGVSFKWIAHSSENAVAGPGIGATRRLRLRVRVTTIRVLPWQNFRPMIHMTAEDFDTITHGRALCDADGAIDAAGFEIMMREQVSSDMIRRESLLNLGGRSEGHCTGGANGFCRQRASTNLRSHSITKLAL